MQLGENPGLKESVQPDNSLKEWLINYVGEKLNPDNDQVTLEMMIEILAEEFPEFLLAVAEENWIRGYHQALTDAETGRDMAAKENAKNETNNEE